MQDKTKYHSAQQSEELFSDQHQNSINIRVNPKLITTAINEGFLTQLAFFYFLRYHYKYLHISNEHGNPKRRISQLSGLSQPTIDKYFRILIQHNLIKPTVHGYELAITAPRHKRFKVNVSTAPTVNELKQLLFYQVMRDAGQQQLLIQQIKNYCLPKEEQSLKLTGSSTLFTSFAPCFSVRYLSAKLHISGNTVRKLITNLNDSCVIRTVSADSELLLEDVMPGTLKHLDGFHGHRWYKNGCIWGVQPSQHTFVLQPIMVKPMTFDRYKRVSKDTKFRQLIWQTQKMLMN